MTTILNSQSPKLLTKNFMVLFMAHFLFGLSFWPYVLLPAYLQDLGADLLLIGIIMSVSSLAGILIRLWVGPALDRIGRKKCLFIGGIFFLSTHLLYFQVDEISWMIFMVRIFHGISMGILMASFFTLAVDLSPEERRTEGIAYFGIAGHLSGAIGVTMGEKMIEMGGFPLLFLVSAGFALLTILLFFWIKEPDYHSYEGKTEPFMKVLLLPSLRLPFTATIAFSVSLTSYMIFLKPYAHFSGISLVTPFFLAYTLTAVGVRLIGGSWPDRFGLRPVLYPSMISMALGIFLLTLMPSQQGLIISGILCGIGHGFIFPILSVMVIGNGHSGNQGKLMTLYTLTFDIGLLIGPPLLGFIARGGDYVSMYILAALIQIASLLAFVISGQSKRREVF